jgi:hypothetical protein
MGEVELSPEQQQQQQSSGYLSPEAEASPQLEFQIISYLSVVELVLTFPSPAEMVPRLS